MKLAPRQASLSPFRRGSLITALAALWILATVPGAGCGDDSASGNDNDNQNNASGGVCGDGVQDLGEQCDNGAENSDSVAGACRTDCRTAWCGDGVQDAGEDCDEGPANSDRLANACRRDCRLPGCGDGVLDAGEDCDDGNLDAGDGCAPSCTVEAHWRCDAQPSQCACEDYWRGAGCDECVVYVDVSQTGPADGRTWATAFSRPQEAVDVANQAGPGCEIWIAAGIYEVFGTNQQVGLSVPGGMSIYGGFSGDETDRGQRDPDSHRTVLSGEGGPSTEQSFHVVTVFDATDVLLDGITITGGAAASTGMDRLGGGVLALRSQLRIQNCRIAGNLAEYGGGLYIYDSAFELVDSVVSGNALLQTPATLASRGAGLFVEASTALVTGSWFHGNFSMIAASGIGIYVRQSDLTLEDSVVSQNATADGAGGGLLSDSVSTVHVNRCRFVGNQATSFGGGIYSLSPGTLIESSLLASNHGSSGGAIFLDTDATILNSTIAYNVATDSGGGVYVLNGAASLASVLLWGNTAVGLGPQLRAGGTGTLQVDRCLVQGGWTGDNLSGPPGFVAGADVPQPQGTWTAVEYGYAADEVWTRFTDSTASWIPGALAGRLVWADISTPLWAVIADNTATEILLKGAFIGYPVNVGDSYAIYDLRLGPTSPAIDAGFDDAATPTLDLDGLPRVDLPAANTGVGTLQYVDIGAYERQP